MANALAVANVTESLCVLLREPVQAAVHGAEVLAGRPDAESGEDSPRIGVWLYSAAADPAARNARPPLSRGEDNDGAPGLPLILSYMISVSGPDRSLDREILFGAVAAALHGRPLLDPALIARAAAARPGLGPSNLAQSGGEIAIHLVDPGEAAIAGLWAGLPGVARRLSLFCAVGPVTLDPVRLPAASRA